LTGLGALPQVPKPPKTPVDTNPLSEKEGKELLPRMVEILQTVFRYVDMGITMTNAERAEAYIWRTIDPEDCKVIAELLIEAGKKNRVVATGVRRLAMSYKLLQVGIITVPRFIQTYQHYAQHGGFALFGGGNVHAQIQAQRQIVPSGAGAVGGEGTPTR
jgi:hypothetical protein